MVIVFCHNSIIPFCRDFISVFSFFRKKEAELKILTILRQPRLPHADIVADKYHVIRQANWMIRDVRIRLFNSDIKYKEYKKYWKLIAKNPNSTFSPSQKKRLKKLKNLSEIF